MLVFRTLLILVSISVISYQPALSQKLIRTLDIKIDRDIASSIRDIKRVDKTYFLLDERLQQVLMTDSTFAIFEKFDAASCHPGVGFAPHYLTKSGKSSIIVSSNPIFAYLYNVKTGVCGTRESEESRFIPTKAMVGTDQGILRIDNQRGEVLVIEEYGDKLERKYSIAISDEFAFKNLRSRVQTNNSMLKYDNKIYLLNEYDFSVIILDINDLFAGKPKPFVIPIRISNANKVASDISKNQADMIDMVAIRNAVNGKHIMNGMYKINQSQYAFDVKSDLVPNES